ncbi:MAG: fasciclin domain-containing protein [Hyphomonadaceae bacterium]|nr:fasciclin domain-containing protein [Hyphomonadaceae bacterium]MCA8885780.1 fasciclin domain-containing protein [Hyphomonadaceae bacterium]
MFQRPLRAALFALACALTPQAAIAQTADRFFVAETQTPNPDGDILDVAAATGQFTRFLAAVQAAGFEETLRGEGPFTIFAPTDEAFRQMDQAQVARLMQPQNRDELLALLAYHVIPERVTTESVGHRTTRPESANGYRVTLDGRDGLRVNDELVVMPDISASNGVIQGINRVLAPPVLVAEASTNAGR